jgi:2-polyprenyl-3-methyl-5-hydroxy-6-metoxy-1,4-benzoquinol methylase
MTVIDACPVCRKSNFAQHLECKDHSVSHETFKLVRCEACQLVITSPRPSREELGRYYISEAYTSHIRKGRSTLDKAYLLARTFTLKWKLSIVKEYTTKTNQTLLDFGSGVGEFMKTARQKGWNTYGVEPSMVARQNADPSISQYILSSLDDVPSDHHFDAITAWHVLEHVEALNETIEALKRKLNKGGTIFIAVPNHNSWDAQRYKQYWAAYDVPRHLWHFNQHSMTQLLSAHSLDVIAIVPMRLDAFYISLLSEKYCNNSLALTGVAKTVINGVRSNVHARTSKEYSSLIYIAKR